MADGKVVISTELDNSRIPAGIRAVKGALGGLKNVAKKMETTMQSALGSKDLELEARQMAEAVGELGTKAELAIQKQLAAFTKQNALYARQKKKVDVLKLIFEKRFPLLAHLCASGGGFFVAIPLSK